MHAKQTKRIHSLSELREELVNQVWLENIVKLVNRYCFHFGQWLTMVKQEHSMKDAIGNTAWYVGSYQ